MTDNAAQYTYAERRALTGAHVTLDRKPAIISGAREPFATVRALDLSASVEYSWETVGVIVSHGGTFFTR